MSSTRAFVREHPVAAAVFLFLAMMLGLWILLICYFTFGFLTSSSCTFERMHSIAVAGMDIEVAHEDCMRLIASPTYVVVRASEHGDRDPTLIFRCDCGIEIEPIDAHTIRLVVPVDRASVGEPLTEPTYSLLQPNWRGRTFTYAIREVDHKR